MGGAAHETPMLSPLLQSPSGPGGPDSAGLRQIREGRQARFDAAKQALDARRASQGGSSQGGDGDR